MPSQTFPLQDGIEYKSAIIEQICNAADVLRLLADDPNLEVEDDRAFRVCDEDIFDFNYIDRTVTRSDAFLMVDAEMIEATSGTMYAWEVFVQVVCHKDYMRLDPKKFRGVKGNRIDNLSKQIDALLNGSSLFGIGRLKLQSCNLAVVPDNFTSKLLTYRVEDFRRSRSK